MVNNLTSKLRSKKLQYTKFRYLVDENISIRHLNEFAVSHEDIYQL